MTTGILPLEDLKSHMVANTAFFETNKTVYPDAFGVTSGNWDGAGMSLGALQINFGPANRLSGYFQHMINNENTFCNNLWLNNGLTQANYDSWKTLMLGSDTTAKHSWADSISDPAIGANGQAKGDLIAPYTEIFRQMGIHQTSIDKQVEISETLYMPVAFKAFNQMTCNSRLALASFYDLSINRGRCFPMNLIQVDFEAIDANNGISATEKERQKIYQINYRGCWDNNNSATGEVQHWDYDGAGGYAGRRLCMADQTGNYFGDIYDPDVQFEMTQDIALEEKAIHDLKLGIVDIDKIYLGLVECTKIYSGTEMVYSKPYKANEAPQTTFRKLKNDPSSTGITGSVSMASGEKLWVDVRNWIACRTYYTLDGSTPTTNSALYTNALTFDSSCTLKTLTVSVEGIAEAVKTLTVTVASNLPVTTISPSETVQNSIPITVTLSATNSPTAIYYKLGTTGTQQTYTAPFQVNQNSTGVSSTNIKVTYWAVNANGTEPEKSITYDTSGAIPSQSVLTATASAGKVDLSWTATTNTTAYTLFRSTDGTLGTFIGTQYMPTSQTTYSDTAVTNGTTYYYTLRAGNFSANRTDSVQKTATPTAAPTKPTYRYIKFEGYGGTTAGAELTTRGIELEVMSGGTNRVLNKTILSSETVSTGTGTPAMMINGSKATTANTYPIWWTAVPNGRVVIDMGAQYAIDQINYYSLSNTGDLRAYKFKVLGSNTNNGTDWATIWDMSANTTVQPALPTGNYTISF